MNIYDFAPIRLLISAADWSVTALSDLLQPLTGSASAALAVIVLTILVRIVLIPVGVSQVKAGIARQRLAPRIAELQKRHRNNPEVLQRKIMELYTAEKVSPVAGCLPVLAQTPVLMALYGLFILPTIDGSVNLLLGHSLLGIGLGTSLFAQITAGVVTWQALAVFLGIMAIIAVVAQASRRLVMPQPLPQAAPQPGAPDLTGMTRMLSFMPFLTVVIAAFVPLAAALYLMTTTTWTLGERVVLRKILGADA